ncbi:hypothetical protein K469DRAFT_669562 [Zopfia rhizophila CBS 207.26]|uniref:BHLH domain-containing protein n=1 Tax=Zopfia rhizophila CBS 207.26 TaxID=1314779 RepID=A0A6A6DW28_9PEZI|nr:hypothetical protein K469DRAFT_669562 [Zopfia rhizophila CBS 207.26]
MSLNWNAFLTDEGLNLPNDQWFDIPSSTAGRLSDMPKPTSRTAGAEASDLSGFDSAPAGTIGEPYFDETLFNPNDYFLSDLEVLQPFGDTFGEGESTSESSPEPTTGIALTGHTTPASASTGSNQSSPMPSAQKQLQRAQTLTNPIYESMFPNNLESGFVEDLTFPNGPTGPASTAKSSVDNNSKSEGNTTVKRNKAKPDILSACWTSPLCPNHDQDGPPPNPSNCGGGCAPFLFASEDTLPTPTVDSNLLAREVTLEDIPEGVVEIQPRPKKRTESEASSKEPSGRQFPNANTNTTEVRPRMMSETSQDSPEQVPSQSAADDGKPKSRRRLPHNQVERKYRESLNTQLDSLRRVVPALQQNQRSCDGADIEDLPTPSKPSKAVILASATAYIKQMEKDKKNLQEENQLLMKRVKALQALVKCEDCSLMQYVMDLKINQPT